MIKNNKLFISALSFSCLSLASLSLASLAHAEDDNQQSTPWTFSPVVEVSAGLDLNQTGTYSPCATGCGITNQHGTDTRSGAIVRFGFQGVDATQLFSTTPVANHLRFLPISVILDGGSSDGFGHVEGAQGFETPVRQVLGVLVDGNFNPGNSILQLRGKLVRIDYDRDKGIFDWRALDASIGLEKTLNLGSDRTQFNVEVDVGNNVGGIKLNNMADLSKALDIAPVLSSAITMNPYAALRAGIHSQSIKVELIVNGERRVDLTPESSRPVFKGRKLGVDSDHASATVEVEYTFDRKGLQKLGRRYSIFVDGTADVDTLTLSDTLFGTGDLYRDFMVLGGFRAQF